METSTARIREIRPKDNPATAKMVRSVLIEMGMPKVGTAYADKALDAMFEQYDAPRSAYFLLVDGSDIVGAAGIAPLDNHEGNVCELQKMYFLEAARGRGLGTRMMETCLAKAREFGYDQVYIETMPYMKAARKLYVKFGFEYIDAPMGDTGHYSCQVWMLKTL